MTNNFLSIIAAAYNSVALPAQAGLFVESRATTHNKPSPPIPYTIYIINTSQVYPTHIYEPIRIKIANEYEIALSLLKSLTKLSKSGKYKLKERVLIGKSEFRIKLKKDLKLN